MSETVAPVPAASLSPSTPVVVAAVHKSIVSELEADLSIVEATVEALWAAHEVVIITFVAFVFGIIVRSFI